MGLMQEEKGQTVVEYILLLTVVVFMVTVVLKSGPMKKLLGPDAELLLRFKRINEYAYRHALSGPKGDEDYDPTQVHSDVRTHPSYATEARKSRFFGPRKTYP